MTTSRLQTARRRIIVAALTLSSLALATPVFAQSAAVRYQRAQAREAAARKQAAPSVTTLRAIATAYEAIVRRYPSNGYADNALWQAASVLELAYQRAKQDRDREQATRLLAWLGREYPHSPLAKQAKARLAALDAAAVASTAPAAAPASVNTAARTPASSAPAATAPAAPATAAPTPAPAVAPPAAAAAAPRTAAVKPTVTAPPAAPANSTAPTVMLKSVTRTALPKGDRLTFELSEESLYTAERISNARQLKFTLANVGLSTEALDAVTMLRGALVQSVRLTAKNGTTEVVVVLNGQPRHSAFPLYNPYRLVVDLESDAPVAALPASAPTSSNAPVALKTAARPDPAVISSAAVATAPASVAAPPALPATPAPATTAPLAIPIPPALPSTPPVPSPVSPASTSRGGYSLARQLGLSVSRIVIDPGHGGHDPGASANGVTESELVLDVALRLEKLLQDQPGFEVVLTRRTNEFIALEARTALANRETADLFLSIHANSSPQRDTRGIETYFLNFATNSHAEGVAARENASASQSMRVLPQLVKAIATNNKLAESREFAGMVQASLLRQARVQSKDVKDLGVKQAPFVVLLGAEMPSVLAEIAFLTNRADATQLKQPAYRQRIAQALRDAVLRYQGSLKKVSTVAAATEGR